MKMWRTLVRIAGVNDNSVSVCIPGWDPMETVEIPLNSIPQDIVACMSNWCEIARASKYRRTIS